MATTIQKTIRPELTETEKELYQATIDLAKLQAAEAKRQSAAETELSPLRTELAKTQLEQNKAYAEMQGRMLPQQLGLMEERLGLAGRAQTALTESLTPTNIQKLREERRKQYYDKTLAQIRGEASPLSAQEETKLGRLEGEYIGRGQEQIGIYSAELKNLMNERALERGMKLSASAGSQIDQETAFQLAKTGRAGQMLGLETRLSAGPENLQNFEAQRQFEERLGIQTEADRINAYLSAIDGTGGNINAMSGGTGGVKSSLYNGQGGVMPPNLTDLLQQLEQKRLAEASTSQYIAPLPKTQTAISGAMTGGMTGMTAGYMIGGPFGAVAGGALGAIGGGIFGYNA